MYVPNEESNDGSFSKASANADGGQYQFTINPKNPLFPGTELYILIPSQTAWQIPRTSKKVVHCEKGCKYGV